MLNPGSILGGRYEIEEKIGLGGMAVVYKAKDYKLHREVAIKVLKPELSADEVVLSKFRKEGLAAASLSHNNIVGVYDLGREQDADYIVMEYIDGITLKEYIQRRGRLSNDEILKISIKIADALKAAHAKNIIHRDIKPQNIMVTPNGGVKVTDFGIAKATTVATMTGKGEAMGSVHYFSPEQARGRHVDKRSDLYSMGITMFEMATSQLPFEGDTPVATAMKQIHDPLPDILKINPEIWTGLVSIIRKLTNKQPEERYQDAGEVLEDLKKVYQNHGYTVKGPAAAHTEYVPPKDAEEYDDEDEDYDEDEYEEDDRPNGKKIAIIAGIGVVCVAFIAIVLWSFLGGGHGGVVPRLVGYEEMEAASRAQKSGYNMVVTQQQYDESYDTGIVISQTPEDGAEADEGTTISVVLSMGKYMVNTVPECENQPYDTVVDTLISLGIPYRVQTEASTEVEMGNVISQEPKAGEELLSDTTIVLTVSSGGSGEGIPVPDLKGKTREEATEELSKANLSIGEVSLSAHDTVPAGKIIAQDLDAGSLVPEGTTVNVTISQGTPNDDEEEALANGTIVITNPLPEGQTSGRLKVEAIDARGNSTGLCDQDVTKAAFGSDGMEVSYPSGTVKIRVYLDGKEVFVRDIN